MTDSDENYFELFNRDYIEENFYIDHEEQKIYKKSHNYEINLFADLKNKYNGNYIIKGIEENKLSQFEFKKFNVEFNIQEQEIGEFKFGVDKIIEAFEQKTHVSTGYKLVIKINGIIIHSYEACTDDYKYGTHEEHIENIKKVIKQKQIIYTKFLYYVDSLKTIQTKQTKLTTSNVAEQSYFLVPPPPLVSAQAGGLKKFN